MRAPSVRIPAICRLTGRAPIAHPPGVETRARPARASSGPSTRNEARMVLTRSYGASCAAIEPARNSTSCSPLQRDCTPRRPSNSIEVRTSRSRGTLRITTGSSVSSAAIRHGSAAFLLPESSTAPRSGAPPRMIILSMLKSASPPVRAAADPNTAAASGKSIGCARAPRDRFNPQDKISSEPARGARRLSGAGEEVGGRDEMADAGGARRGGVDLLIADHGRARQVHAIDRGQLGHHPALGLTARASIGVVVRAYLPAGQVVSELPVELGDCGCDLLEAQPAARDSGLVGHDEDQMVANRAELVRNSRQQFNHDLAVGCER